MFFRIYVMQMFHSYYPWKRQKNWHSLVSHFLRVNALRTGIILNQELFFFWKWLLRHSSPGYHYRLIGSKNRAKSFSLRGSSVWGISKGLNGNSIVFFGCLFLSYFLFFCLLFGCPTANFGLLSGGQPHSLDVYQRFVTLRSPRVW